MKSVSIITALFLLMIFTFPSFADESRIPDFASRYISNSLNNYHSPEGQLDEFMREHLSKEGKSTRPWSIVADFNGDKKDDWAGLLSDSDKNMDIVLIYSSGNYYKHNVLYKGAGKDTDHINTGVYIENPGIVHGFPFDEVPEKDLVANLVYPGIHIVFFETSSVLYYFKENQIQELWTSD